MKTWMLGWATLTLAMAGAAGCTVTESGDEGTGGSETGGSGTGGVGDTGGTGGSAGSEGGAGTTGGAGTDGGAGNPGGASATGGTATTGGAGGAGEEPTGTGTVLPGDPCANTIECIPGALCFEEICVQTGNIRVSLAWTDAADLDLYVGTPDGSEISYGNPIAGGGELDVDDCVFDGAVFDCADPTGTHVENVFFTSAASGDYSIWVDPYDSTADVSYTLTVVIDGTIAWTETAVVEVGVASTPHVITY